MPVTGVTFVSSVLFLQDELGTIVSLNLLKNFDIIMANFFQLSSILKKYHYEPGYVEFVCPFLSKTRKKVDGFVIRSTLLEEHHARKSFIQKRHK